MIKYPKSKTMSKLGINYIRNIIEQSHSIFNEIHDENDLGIDALIELTKDEKPLNKIFAIQIKSGESYFNKKSKECLIPVGKHFDYWINYPLPIFGMVYVPSLDRAFWIDIKQYLESHSDCSIIKFQINDINTLTLDSFTKIFIPYLLKEIPDLSFEESLSLFQSKNYSEYSLGIIILFKKFAYRTDVWDKLINFFKNKPYEEIPSILVYYMSYIPWHSDIDFYEDSITPDAKNYAKKLILEFGKNEVLKLLKFIDEENMIARGIIGQSVEAIISIIPNFEYYLVDFIKDNSLDMLIRESSAAIYAYHKGYDCIDILSSIKNSWYISEIIRTLREYKSFDLYL